jgi:hypothetical protein
MENGCGVVSVMLWSHDYHKAYTKVTCLSFLSPYQNTADVYGGISNFHVSEPSLYRRDTNGTPRVESRISPEKAIVPASFVHYEHADTDEMLQMSRQVHDAKATNIVMDAFRYFRK